MNLLAKYFLGDFFILVAHKEGGYMDLFITTIVDETGTKTYDLTVIGYVAIVAITILFFGLSVFLFGKKNKKTNVTKLAVSAMALALAVIGSLIPVCKMPMGGEVTFFSMLFIVIIGYWYGIGSGLMVAVAYGLIQLMINPFIIGFPQVFLDYILAFGALGLSGIFKGKKYGLVLGYIVSVLGRLLFSTISGAVFFEMYATGFPNAWAYSIVYNGSYIGLEAAITIVILLMPHVNKAFKSVEKMVTK